MSSALGGWPAPDPIVIDHATDPVQSDSPSDDPLALAAHWLPAPDEARMLMTLSTVGGDGAPHARTVMLSEFDGERFFFHTDARSAKVTDLAAHPRVALTLLWPGFTRQLVVEGVAEQAPVEEVAEAYRLRSPYLQQLAWQNTAAFAQRPLAARAAEWSALLEQSGGAQAPQFAQPEGWAGFAVTPARLLFWVSNPAAASRRLAFTREGEGWAREYLPG